MRYTTPIAIILFASSITFNVQATEKSDNPCDLLDWQDFQTFGVVKETTLVNTGWRQVETPKEMPDSEVWSNMCVVTLPSDEGSSFLSLTVESIQGKVSKEQIGEWLIKVAAKDSELPDVTAGKVGDSTCENGKYDLPTKSQNDKTVVVEHYVACDQLVENMHISLNLHVPEGKQGDLPNPEQVAALLDKSIVRLKNLAIAKADKPQS